MVYLFAEVLSISRDVVGVGRERDSNDVLEALEIAFQILFVHPF